jgi:L-ribulose-5-phosphate 3-epimerase
VQLTPSFPGLRFHEPGQFTPERCRRAAAPFQEAGVAVACVAGATNLMDPDLDRRHRGIVRLHALIRHCRDFGTTRVVTETGGLSPLSPWTPYSSNRSAEAWAELRLIVAEALLVSSEHGVTLLLKAEPTHVLATADDAIRLCEELAHPNLGFVMDPATLLLACDPAELGAGLERLFARLGPWCPVAHAKDVRFDREGVATPRAGLGVLDYGLFLRLLDRHQPAAPLILEHLRPEDAADAVAYVRRHLDPATSEGR